MKYFSVPIHVDATGFVVVAVPEDFTEEQIKEFALDVFFPTNDNTEYGDPIDALEPSEITAEEFSDYKHKGLAEIYE